jgi:hypothetical protein
MRMGPGDPSAPPFTPDNVIYGRCLELGGISVLRSGLNRGTDCGCWGGGARARFYQSSYRLQESWENQIIYKVTGLAIDGDDPDRAIFAGL